MIENEIVCENGSYALVYVYVPMSMCRVMPAHHKSYTESLTVLLHFALHRKQTAYRSICVRTQIAMLFASHPMLFSFYEEKLCIPFLTRWANVRMHTNTCAHVYSPLSESWESGKQNPYDDGVASFDTNWQHNNNKWLVSVLLCFALLETQHTRTHTVSCEIGKRLCLLIVSNR